jgi:hypothetical protein
MMRKREFYEAHRRGPLAFNSRHLVFQLGSLCSVAVCDLDGNQFRVIEGRHGRTHFSPWFTVALSSHELYVG